MDLHLTEIVLRAFIPLTLRTMLYLVACRLRSIQITFLNAITLAGVASLVGFLPIPSLLRQPLTISVGMFLLTRYTEAELFPDVIFIPIIIELSSAFLVAEVLVPMLA
jgi:hypothetical protein